MMMIATVAGTLRSRDRESAMKIAIVGAGFGGCAAARFCREEFPEAEIHVAGSELPISWTPWVDKTKAYFERSSTCHKKWPSFDLHIWFLIWNDQENLVGKAALSMLLPQLDPGLTGLWVSM